MSTDHELIKYQLRSKGKSCAQIARALNITDGGVSLVLKGARSRRVEKAIADALGEPVEFVFPERYPKSAA